jgi:TIR domain
LTGSVTPEWDLFIAHASEDKDGFVRPLAGHLEELGVRVWFDEFELQPGDSLVGTIDRGLANSACGLLIISKAFLRKPWPEYERRGLITRELAGDHVVIPVWRDVDHSEVAAFSPPLADKFAITTDDVSTVALEVLRSVRPDLFRDLSRRLAHERHIRNLPTESVPLDKIDRETLVRRERLPRSLMYRLLLIHESTADVLPIPFADTVLNFQRDENPENEAEVWELLAATYLHIVREDKLPPSGHKEVLGLALTASTRPLNDDDDADLTHTSVERFLEARKVMAERLAMFD